MTEHDNDNLHGAINPAALGDLPEHARAGHDLSGEPTMDSDIDYKSVLMITIIGTLITIATILALKAFFWQTLHQEKEAKLLGTSQSPMYWHQFTDLRAKQEGDLLSPSQWTDAKLGLVSIPLEKAEQLVLAEEQRKQSEPQPATPPAAAVTGAPAAAPASGTSAAPAAADATKSEETGSPAATPSSGGHEGSH